MMPFGEMNQKPIYFDYLDLKACNYTPKKTFFLLIFSFLTGLSTIGKIFILFFFFMILFMLAFKLSYANISFALIGTSSEQKDI
jgi:hypothetical protein